MRSKIMEFWHFFWWDKSCPWIKAMMFFITWSTDAPIWSNLTTNFGNWSIIANRKMFIIIYSRRFVFSCLTSTPFWSSRLKFSSKNSSKKRWKMSLRFLLLLSPFFGKTKKFNSLFKWLKSTSESNSSKLLSSFICPNKKTNLSIAIWISIENKSTKF